MCTVSHIGFCNTILCTCSVVSVQVWVVFIDLIKFDVSMVAIWISGPDVARTGAHIKPGIRNTALASVLILEPSSGIDLIVDMISISKLE